jgi:hypothetical protein
VARAEPITLLIRARRPKNVLRAPREYWPGAPAPRENGLLAAELWRDSRVVTLLNLAYFSKEATVVERWPRSARTHVTGECSVALSRYTQRMCSVDEMNKCAAETNIRTARCRPRYHRLLHRARAVIHRRRQCPSMLARAL